MAHAYPEGVAARVANADAVAQRLHAEPRGLDREEADLETSVRVKGSADLQAVLRDANLKVTLPAPIAAGSWAT